MEKLKEAKISDLEFDNKNFNKHTEFGMSLIEKSLRSNGAGRSILIDKNNRIIGGNGVVEIAGQIGLEDVQIVESDGTKLIAVKRTDIDIDTVQGREMALADNATAAADLKWDTDALAEVERELEINTKKWGVFFDDKGESFFKGERTAESDDAYDEFTEKFKPKLTTDDCYTPKEVYDVVADYVRNIVGNDRPFVRPFFPGGDYQKFDYPANCVVVDNPPFSIYAEIVRWYIANGIDFFIFAPSLTQVVANSGANYVAAGVDITYENGAVVRTSFTTNLLGDIAFTTAPRLKAMIEEVNGKDPSDLPVYGYDSVITTALLLKLGCTEFSAKFGEVHEIGNLDCLKEQGKSLFGRGWLLNERKERERKERELPLSEREREIIEMLNKRDREANNG